MPENNNTSKSRKSWMICIGICLITALAVAILGLRYLLASYNGNPTWIYITDSADRDTIENVLIESLGEECGEKTYSLWKIMGGEPTNAHGAYRVEQGANLFKLARHLSRGQQSPVKVTWNNVRTLDDLSSKVASQLECSEADLKAAILKVAGDSSIKESCIPAYMIPDTYEFYWTASPEQIASKFLLAGNRFWNESRQNKAEKMNLSRNDIFTIASIVEEESAQRDEYGKIARLYINRLRQGMKLQADPTVKFAIGDFTIKRVTQQHTSANSPYNTYRVEGLPPGPIRFVDPRTIDSVLDSPTHDFIYMCAKEDFSGYHNFAQDYATHQANASRYRKELDRRNIH